MRRILLLLFLITDLALILRLAAASRFGESNIVTYSESGITANNWVTGKGYTFDFFGERPEHPLQAYMPPIYTGLIALCLKFSANPALTLEFIQAILSTLTVIAIFFVALEYSHQPTAALITAFAASVYPVFVLMSAVPIQTTLNIFLLLVLVLSSLMLSRNHSTQWGAVTGILLGITALSRPALVGYFPLLFIWLWVNVRRARVPLVKTATPVVLFALLILLPWMFRNYQVLGRFGVISTNGGFPFWQGNNPFTTGSGFDVYSEKADQFLGLPHDSSRAEIIQAAHYPLPKALANQIASVDEIELEQGLYQAGFEFIRNNPGRWFELVITKLGAFWWFRANIGEVYEASWTPYYKILYSVLLVLVIPGLVLSLRNWRRYLLLYMLILYCSLTYMIFNVLTRYRWEIEPFFLIFAALTVVWLWEKIRARTPRRRPASNA